MKTINGTEFRWEWRHGIGNSSPTDGKPARRHLPLTVRYVDGYYESASQNVKFIATVTAQKAEDPTRYKVGFTQTIYTSMRDFYYFSSRRTRVVEKLSQVPAWDGDQDDTAPWYGSNDGENPVSYDGEDQKLWIVMDDAPRCMQLTENPKHELRVAKFGWEKDPRAMDEGATLFYIGGYDSFATFLCVRDAKTQQIHVLDAIPWYVKFDACIDSSQKSGTPATGSGTFLGATGQNNTGQAKLDGESAEFYDSASFLNWDLNSLPLTAKEWLKFKKP